MLSMSLSLKALLHAQVLLFLMAGCASYDARKIPVHGTSRKEVTLSSGALEVRALPMFDKETANTYLGIDPAEGGMVPVHFVIRNNGVDPVKIESLRSHLADGPGERFRSLSFEESCARARRSDAEVVGWTLAFGLIGGIASGSQAAEANRSLEADYHHKQFRPTLINPGGTGEGVLFFDVPKEKQPQVRFAVIAYLDLATNETTEIAVDLR